MYYCDKCGKPACKVTWLEVNGHRTEQHLCADCAGYEQDISEFVEPMIGEFFDFPLALNRRKPSKRTITCGSCGYSNKDFIETGMVNCPDCFKYFMGFGDLMEDTGNKENEYITIDSIKLNNTERDTKDIKELQKRLDKAVMEQRYEDAAILKKQIDDLEGK